LKDCRVRAEYIIADKFDLQEFHPRIFKINVENA